MYINKKAEDTKDFGRDFMKLSSDSAIQNMVLGAMLRTLVLGTQDDKADKPA